MRADLRRDLAIAIRQRDEAAVSALRTALAAIENAEAVSPAEAEASRHGSSTVAGSVAGLGAAEAPRRDLTADDIERIVSAERSELLAAAGEYERHGHGERAERLRAEARVLDRYL